MPYIKQEQRELVKSDIDRIANEIAKMQFDDPEVNVEGVVNYVISRLLETVYTTPSYREINDVIGVLECAKMEYYRKHAAPYEDLKEQENGPVTE